MTAHNYTIMLYHPDANGNPVDDDTATKHVVWVRKDEVPMVPNEFTEVAAEEREFALRDEASAHNYIRQLHVKYPDAELDEY